MPFYWIPRTIEPETLVGDAIDVFPAYDMPRAAHAAKPSGDFSLYYRETLAERAEWADRELSRFESGEYRAVPWSDDDRYWLHFAHLSQTEAGKIAYTIDPERGIQDRQNIVPIDRYLSKYYADVAESKRREWAATDLQLATTADDCERLYKGKAYTRKPFFSCIGYGHSFDVHPARVYGDSDLAVAYIGSIDAALARAVVWPDKHVYNRIFCTWIVGTDTPDAKIYDRFVALLTAAGYVSGSLTGAKIRKIEHPDGGLVMPYIDNVSGADDTKHRDYLVLGRGNVSTCETSGIANGIETRECDNCGSDYEVDDDHTSYCYSCENDRCYCEQCDTDRFGMTFYTVPGCNFGRSYSREMCEECTESDSRSRRRCALCSSRWYEWQLDESDQQDRHDNGTDRFCTDCADSARVCSECDDAYETDDDDDGKCTDCRKTDDDTTDHDQAMEVLADKLATDDQSAT